jgi:hypothetical protein
MPLFNQSAARDNEAKNPNIKPEQYKDVVVDSKYVDLRNLLLHVEGMRWVANEYYSQYVTKDTELASQEINRHEVYQQYLLIKNMELRVTTPLSADQNAENGEFNISGRSTLYPGLVPNSGDMFTADVGDGRVGLFTVDEVSRKTHLTDSTFEIGYTCTELLSPTRKKDLESKVQKVQTFVKEFVSVNRNPYLVSAELEAYRTIKSYQASLPETYYSLFYSQEFSTLLIPDQMQSGLHISVYDPHLTDFVKSVISMERHARLTSVRSIHCDTAETRKQQTLFDALLRRDISVLETCSIKSVRYYAKEVKQRPEFFGIRYSGIEQLYAPVGNDLGYGIKLLTALNQSVPRVFNKPTNITTHVDLDELRSVPLIHPVTLDDYYVLSKNFYDLNHEGMSLLEILTYQRLSDTPNDLILLMELVKSASKWGRLEQYYYYPILIYLLIYAMGDIN